MSTMVVPRRMLRSGLIICVLTATLALSACSSTSEDDQVGLAIEAVRPNEGRSFAMAADALDRGVVDAGDGGERIVVVVPTDDALLSLDADTLARITSQDGISELLRRSVVQTDYEAPPRRGLTFLLTDGTPVFIDEVDGQLLVNSIPLRESVTHDGFELLVVDGFVVQP